MRFFNRAKKEERLCPNCKKPVPEGIVFCESCGLRQLPPPTCGKCSLPLAPEANFCESCGTPAGVTPPPEPAPAVVGNEETGEQKKADRSRKKGSKRRKKNAANSDPGNGHGSHGETGAKEPVPAHNPGLMNKPAEQGNPSPMADNKNPACGKPIPQRPFFNKKKAAVVIGIVFFIILISVSLSSGWMPGKNAAEKPQFPTTLQSQTTGSPDSAGVTETSVPARIIPVVAVTITPGPTQVPPESLMVWIQAEREPITSEVTVLFEGGKGQRAVRDVTARLTRSDGEIITRTFRPVTVGQGAILQGTRYTDRLEVIVNYNNGDQFTVIDKLFEYKRRE